MDLDLEFPVLLPEDQPECISELFASESEHMPLQNYFERYKTRDLRLSTRQESISLILKSLCNLDPFVPYLAISYLDRFMSRQEMPKGKAWISKLISLSCLSLAAKMKNVAFCLSDFQSEERFMFDTQTIKRMELLILRILDWRLRSVTPFSFINFFLSSIKLEDRPSIEALKNRTVEIIIKTQQEINLLEFKPSIIAAAALLCASQEPLLPLLKKAISACEYVNKEKLARCYHLINNTLITSYSSPLPTTTSSRLTPACVLDQQHCCSSNCSSSEITTTSASHNIADNISLHQLLYPQPAPPQKRRKLNDLCTQNIQLSQAQHC
ncbi:putative cyclin-D6-1 isoform X2 [Amborella trichopoda]|uniref:putative cyclin-D6-1 isoform X2 n=1 Tax=Amborella trichopoda TaxID=13333 RepID=UPI0009C16DBD|nr:putative cyclin-D6-1 isoform X2 [Amborella trichopoda]|eukprot:XP_020518110.1 putative cyclin-D6-1 isoform X2 [Amborella trichopoda]